MRRSVCWITAIVLVMLALSGGLLNAAEPRATAPKAAHAVRLAGVAPQDYYVRIYRQGPGDPDLVYVGAPSMNRDFSWTFDTTLPGEGAWLLKIGAKSPTGAWLGYLDEFTLTTTASNSIITVGMQEGADGYTGTTDCYISDYIAGDESKAFGALDPSTLRLRKVDRKEILVRFELPDVPLGANVQHAILAIYGYLNTNPSGPTIFAYQLLRPWKENTATWLSPQPGASWTQPGAFGEGTDRKADYLDKVCRPVDQPGDTCGVIIPGWHQFDVTAAVQAWANGEPNYGVLLRSWDPYWASSAENYFFSSETGTVEYRPRLIVYYAHDDSPSPTPIPSPTATAIPTPQSTPHFEDPTKWQSGLKYWAPQNRYPRMTGDVDGDGIDDIVAFNPDSGAWVCLSTGTTFSRATNWSTEFGWLQGSYNWRALGDVDGDGRADIVGFLYGDGVYVALSTGASFSASTKWLDALGAFGPQTTHPRLVGDVDGDGKADIVAIHPTDGVYVSLSTGSEFAERSLWSAETGWMADSHSWVALGDVNGDGRTDLVNFRYEQGVYVALSNGTAYESATLWLNGLKYWGPDQRYPRLVGDVTGDGRADVVAWNPDAGVGGGYVAVSTGTKFLRPVQWTTAFAQRANNYFLHALGDVNGDGRADAVFFWYEDGVHVALSSAG